MKKYWKWAFLALPLALLLPASCDKEPKEEPYRAPYEKELRFNHKDIDSIDMPIVQKFARDTACKHIYLTVTNDNNFTSFEADHIEYFRKTLNERIQLAPNKISGRGDFNFMTGVARPADSIWYVQNGWTINQRY